MTLKCCGRCKADKPLTDYPLSARKMNGSYCRQCSREYKAEDRAVKIYSNPLYLAWVKERDTAKQYGRHRANRLVAFSAVVDTCSKCGKMNLHPSDVVFYDKETGEDKSYLIERLSKQLSKPIAQGCNVVCRSCHYLLKWQQTSVRIEQGKKDFEYR